MISDITYIGKHLLTLILVKIPAQLAGLVAVALGLLTRKNDTRYASNKLTDQRLPKCMKYWDIGDKIDLKYGLNGDFGYQSKFLLDSDQSLGSTALQTATNPSKSDLFKMRYNWLALRNPANYFQHNILGVQSSDIDFMIELIEKPDIDGQEVGDYSSSGYRYSEVCLKNKRKIREYYLVYKYPFKKDRCLRIRIGHKLGSTPLQQPRDTIQWCFVIQPWKKYLGK